MENSLDTVYLLPGQDIKRNKMLEKMFLQISCFPLGEKVRGEGGSQKCDVTNFLFIFYQQIADKTIFIKLIFFNQPSQFRLHYIQK